MLGVILLNSGLGLTKKSKIENPIATKQLAESSSNKLINKKQPPNKINENSLSKFLIKSNTFNFLNNEERELLNLFLIKNLSVKEIKTKIQSQKNEKALSSTIDRTINKLLKNLEPGSRNKSDKAIRTKSNQAFFNIYKQFLTSINIKVTDFNNRLKQVIIENTPSYNRSDFKNHFQNAMSQKIIELLEDTAISDKLKFHKSTIGLYTKLLKKELGIEAKNLRDLYVKLGNRVLFQGLKTNNSQTYKEEKPKITEIISDYTNAENKLDLLIKDLLPESNVIRQNILKLIVLGAKDNEIAEKIQVGQDCIDANKAVIYNKLKIPINTRKHYLSIQAVRQIIFEKLCANNKLKLEDKLNKYFRKERINIKEHSYLAFMLNEIQKKLIESIVTEIDKSN
ncbi:MAG: hypothetical protein HRT47_06540 [Candidatus Caenarcaniphilales bacterium]|nr:hypothetical protein [Candidatus Caenarcaniphilales bacterium]